MEKNASRVISAVISIFLFFTSVYFMAIPVALTDWWERYPIYIPEFIMCIVFMLTAFALPITADLLLYRFWYKKAGMSRRWVIIPLAVTYLVLGFLLLVFLGSIPEWRNSFTWEANNY